MTKLIIKKKDFVTLFDEVIYGNTVTGILHSFSQEEIFFVEDCGFFHLTDGTFLCYKSDTDGKLKFCCLDSIESVTLENGTSIELVYTGEGNNFEVKVK